MKLEKHISTQEIVHNFLFPTVNVPTVQECDATVDAMKN